MKKQQLFRFCLYGFLKNQIYFKPFLILVFLEKGFSFLDIGFLISFRALSINLLEIPSGAAADVWGRRRSMILSMSGYIASFILFALVKKYWIFFPAMFLFAIGEAFRTGTHKAMIFDWLRHQGCEEKKTEIYGLTRSWSKIGSAINAWIAAGIVIYTKNYIWIFWASIIPYALNIVNFTFYPDFLDGSPKKKHNINQIVMVLKGGLKLCVKKIDLRNLILQNICFEGFYSIAKEYLQPLIKIAVLTTPIMLAMPEKNRTAILIALIYSLLNIMGSIASRKSHQISKKVGSEEKFS
ncbi:MAG: MFS transporter, partial [Verrucomicrobiota bacterium]|nr:MFS transporter [Verrucomicrobiota bacterium]